MSVKVSMAAAALAMGLCGGPLALADQAREPVSAEEIGRALQDLGKPRSFGGADKPRGVEGIVDDPRPKIGLLIHFDHDSARIKPESFPQLAEVAKALRGPVADAVVAVAGHTDSVGPEDYNLLLSHRRAEAVRGHLLREHGVAAERLRLEAYGEGRPLVAEEQSEADRARNRRVEFIRVGRVDRP
jgi:outer membrane protein OmpA-like peptidoglycan-associated protein